MHALSVRKHCIKFEFDWLTKTQVIVWRTDPTGGITMSPPISIMGIMKASAVETFNCNRRFKLGLEWVSGYSTLPDGAICRLPVATEISRNRPC